MNSNTKVAQQATSLQRVHKTQPGHQKQRMFFFRRRKNGSARTPPAFQQAAETWLRLNTGSNADAIVVGSQQPGANLPSAGEAKCAAEKPLAFLTGTPSRQVDNGDLSRIEPHLVPLVAPESFEAEPYRVLGHLLGQMRAETGRRVIAVSSPCSGDGKTSTTINLAGTLAQEPKTRVLLVEAEIRRPSVARYLGLRHTTGGLVGGLLDPALTLQQIVQHCPPFDFDVLLAGRWSTSPYDVLKLPRFGALFQEARAHYDYVIVDTPPLLPFADCRLIEQWVDGLLVVVAAHKTPRKMLTEALETVDAEKLVGLVLNQDDQHAARYDLAYRYYTRSVKGSAAEWGS